MQLIEEQVIQMIHQLYGNPNYMNKLKYQY